MADQLPARKAFITGASGQDGSYLSERLLHEGWEVHALSHGVDSRLDSRVQGHTGDLSDVERLRLVISSLQPDVVFNLGGLSSVADSWHQPERSSLINGTAVSALLDASFDVQERTGRRVAFVQASSAEIFGAPAQSPQNEETPLRPINPYGAAKAYAHQMVAIYRKRGLAASSAILYNHESPRRSVRFVTRKITSQVAAIAAGSGQRLALGNLEARRDWGWAPDYVEAMVRMTTSEPDDFVIATGISHSVRDFVDASFASLGIQDWEPYVYIDDGFSRPNDAAELRGDATKAAKHLGWLPSIAFEEIVTRMTRHDFALLTEPQTPGTKA